MGLTQLEICNHALLKVGADTIDTLTSPASSADGTKRSIDLCNLFFEQAYDEMLRMYPWNFAMKRVKIALEEIPEEWPESVTISGAGSSDWNITLYDAGVDGSSGNDYHEYTEDGTIGGAQKTLQLASSWEMLNEFGSTDYANLSTLKIVPQNGYSVGSGISPAPMVTYSLPFGYERQTTVPVDLVRLIDAFEDKSMRDDRISWVIEGRKILSNSDELYIKYIYKPEDITTLDSLGTNALICNLALKLAVALQLDDDWAKRINDELYGIVLPQARSIDTLENKELLLEESSWILSRDRDYPSY